MIIKTRGDWRKQTLAKKGIQLNQIATAIDNYKTLLDIPQSDIDRIQGANEMNKYIIRSRNSVKGWTKGLTAYDKQFRDGDIHQLMNSFPALTDLGTAPTSSYAGIWKFIKNRRIVWMAHLKYSESAGDAIGILGPEQDFETDTYKPTLKAKTIPGVIHIHTESEDIVMHQLYAAISGNPFALITTFKGAKYDYHCDLAAFGQVENVNLKLRGVYKNEAIGLESDVDTIAFQG